MSYFLAKSEPGTYSIDDLQRDGKTVWYSSTDNFAGGSLFRVEPGGAPRLLAGTGKSDAHLIVVMTSDRGLCGGFNSTIVREARRLIRANIADGRQAKILCVGRKGRDQKPGSFPHSGTSAEHLTPIIHRPGVDSARQLTWRGIVRYKYP